MNDIRNSMERGLSSPQSSCTRAGKPALHDMNDIRIIISGGGTGGHIFPAVSIANAIRELRPEAQILFVGAQGRMEMQRVPAAGYEIKGLPIRGLLRPLYRLGNIGVMIDFLKSKHQVKRLLRDFRPQVAVGVGGYASSATLNAAHDLHIPCLIQEQNSFAGLTNRSLAHKADRICVAYEGMERFFPKERIMLTGNPVRQNLLACDLTPEAARTALGLDPARPTLLIIGGSLGARTLNESVLSNLQTIAKSPVQVLWQTGGYYKEAIAQRLKATPAPPNLHVVDFISRMDEAYRAASLVVSRAGASSISELCLLGKASILVPSPNVAEDHQTHNAMALVNRQAALIVRDKDAATQLLPLALTTIADEAQLRSLADNAYKMAYKDSAATIAREVLSLAAPPTPQRGEGVSSGL